MGQIGGDPDLRGGSDAAGLRRVGALLDSLGLYNERYLAVLLAILFIALLCTHVTRPRRLVRLVPYFRPRDSEHTQLIPVNGDRLPRNWSSTYPAYSHHS